MKPAALLVSASLLSSCAVMRPPPLETTVSGDAVADVHEHVTMPAALPFFIGEPGGVLAASPDETWVNQVDPSALLHARVRLVFATIWTPPALRPGRDAMDEALHQMEALKGFVRRTPQFALALGADEAKGVIDRGQIALLPAIEGAEAIQGLEDVDRLYAAGFRSIQLVHFTDNAVADAENGQFGALFAPIFDGLGAGLTKLGRAAVARMIDLGILVDVAHASPKTVEDVLQIAEARHVPILSSHVGSGMATARTLEDDQARRIGKLGGLIGVGLYRHDLLMRIPDEDRFPGFVDGTCDEAIAHFLHFEKLAPGSVVLGSDLSSTIHRGRQGGSCAAGIRNSVDLAGLFAALEGHGVDLRQSADRVLETLRKSEAAASPDAQRAAKKADPRPRSPFDVAM